MLGRVNRRDFLGGLTASGTILLTGCGGEEPSPQSVHPVHSSIVPPQPPPSMRPRYVKETFRKLKSALDRGAPRRILPQDPIAAVSLSLEPTMPAGTTLSREDPAVRFKGAHFVPGYGYPAGLFQYPVAVTSTQLGPPGPNVGLHAEQWANVSAFEFVLPAGAGAFEFLSIGHGAIGRLHIDVDGWGTNRTGYDIVAAGDGNLVYHRVDIQPAENDRLLALWTPARPFGGLRFEQGVSARSLPGRSITSAVIIGDSITEGTGAVDSFFGFAPQLSYWLGTDLPIVSGLGGSGYLAAIGDQFNFRERIVDVLEALPAGLPDLAIIAGGINAIGVQPESGKFTNADMEAEARLYFQALRAAAPAMVIAVVGPWSGNIEPSYSGHLFSGRDALFEAARAIPGTLTIDVSEAVTAENREAVFGGTDGVHPSRAGHAIYAETIARQFRIKMGMTA